MRFNRKQWILIIRLLMGAVTLGIVLFFTLPIIKFLQTQPTAQTILIADSTHKSPSLDWMKAHLKLTDALDNETPDLLWIADGKDLDDNLLGKVNQNVIFAESLFMDQVLSDEQYQTIEMLFDIKNTKIVGKMVTELSNPNEVPKMVKDLYEKNASQKWHFNGKGIVLSNETQVIVLLEGKDFKGDLQLESKTVQQPYYSYFEVVQTDRPVEASYRISASSEGLRKLKQLGLTAQFPALVACSTPLYKGYYATGEFNQMAVGVPFFAKDIDTYMANKSLYERNSNEKSFWKWYMKKLKGMLEEAQIKQPLAITSVSNSFEIKGKTFIKTERNGTKSPFFIKGVNLGATLPGKNFTEFPKSVAQYSVWLNQMATLHVNTIRVYTLLPPAFYKALYDFNISHEEKLYLIQEIWPEEKPPEQNYLGKNYNETYQQEMAYVTDAIHGKINIPIRQYRAYGAYAYDVSPYLLGYLVGREMEPEEVMATDSLNLNYQFNGKYLYTTPNASATEAWLAESCEYVLSLEEKNFGSKPLVGIVNWPTLDPLEHDSEWNLEGDKSKQFNDKAVVDINHILIHPETKVGFFGAYHIYPNYPDFINNDPAYANYQDDQGTFRYGGYLNAFMKTQVNYPAIVAEYGISTSMSTAHISPDGLNHGGLTETEQARDIIRMSKAIKKEGYAGAVIFEWMDEWAKKTWTTEPYMIPYSRHPLWHNAMDPEQNYGLMGVRSIAPKMESLYDIKSAQAVSSTQGASSLTKFEMGQNETYLEMTLSFKDQVAASQPLDLLISSYAQVDKKEAWEYQLKVANNTATLLVNPSYNFTKGKHDSSDMPLSTFEHMLQLTNKEALVKNTGKIPAKFIDLSQLNISHFSQSTAMLERQGTQLKIRLPYTLLGITDPSSKKVLSDANPVALPLQDQLKTTTSQEMLMQVSVINEPAVSLKWRYRTWEVPEYYISPKSGFETLSNFFKGF